MHNVQVFTVSPSIPEGLEFLELLSRNLWWSWNNDAYQLLMRISPPLWKQSGYNPLRFLDAVPQKRLEALTQDEAFLAHMERVRDAFELAVSMDEPPWQNRSIAYFSLEYGIHESVRIYSGGLGALAGDHLKAASDMGLPLVAVGLMYRQGYFQQYLNADGWQQEHFPESELHHLPLVRAETPDGQAVTVEVPLPDGTLKACVWLLRVGSIPLYLLDTNIPENPHHYRNITGQLYGGDRQMRLHQELLLGIGGVQTLHALGITPEVVHINEGHAAFLSLARIAHLVTDSGLDARTAREVVTRSTVFTTHTPVAAGNETFSVALLEPFLKTLEGPLGLSAAEVLAWSRAEGDHTSEPCMTVLGMRMARFSNGVSELHGVVARRMWAHLWPGHAQDEVPIGHITNGVHVASWLSSQNAELFDRYIGPDWRNHPGASTTTERISHIPDEELWRAHELGRGRLVRTARERAESQHAARNAPPEQLAKVKSILDQDALTIGFARRFATYKRATLLLSDPDRLEALLNRDDRPVQLIFAGKAHPADDYGKEFIRKLVHFARRPSVRRRMVFLENYDIGIARRLVQGVDVWLNTPRRPQEASGTSGMKAAVNGGINLSVLDGWWCEGYAPDCGWAIGSGEEYADTDYQDSVEAQALYNILENEVIPAFYDRPDGDIPTRWIGMMRKSVKMGLGGFSSHRMVAEYNTRVYTPAREAAQELAADDWRLARQYVHDHERLSKLWSKVRIANPETPVDLSRLHVGDRFPVSLRVHLGDLKPEEVDVELYHGPVNSENHIVASHTTVVTDATPLGDGDYRYTHDLTCDTTGRFAFTGRVTPCGDTWRHLIPGFITWSDDH